MSTRGNTKIALLPKRKASAAPDSESAAARPLKRPRRATKHRDYKEDSDDDWIVEDDEMTMEVERAPLRGAAKSGQAAVAPSRAASETRSQAPPPLLQPNKTASAKAPLSSPAVDLKLPPVKPRLLQQGPPHPQNKAPLAGAAHCLPPAAAASIELRVVSLGQSLGGDLVLLAGTRHGTLTYLNLPALLIDSPAAQQLRGLKCGQCVRVSQVVPQADVRLHAFTNSAPHKLTEASRVEVLPDSQEWLPFQLDPHFIKSHSWPMSHRALVCVSGATPGLGTA